MALLSIKQDPKTSAKSTLVVKKPISKSEPDADEVNKDAPSDSDSDDKKKVAVKLKINAPFIKTPSSDSVNVAGGILSTTYKGKTFDPTDPHTNSRIKRLVGDHVVPMVMKNKGAADKYVSEQKVKNPNYPGATAKELDTVLGVGEGSKHIKAHNIYQQYKDVASESPYSSLQGTKQSKKEHAPASFSGVSRSYTEDLYTPDERLGVTVEAKKDLPMKMPKKK